MRALPLCLPALLLFAACATTPGASPSGTSMVAGIIELPAAAQATPEVGCAGLSIAATTAAGAPAGRVTLRTSRARCSYEIAQLPEAEELVLRVTATDGLRCDGGGPLAYRPTPMRLQLQAHETRTVDFRTQCAPHASR